MRLPPLLLFFFLFVPSSFCEDEENEVRLLDNAYLEDEILNGAGIGENWLVVFYPDPRKTETAHIALRIAELAHIIRGMEHDFTHWQKL